LLTDLGLRVPQQKRSRERRDSFLQAALHLFAEQGYAAVTTDMIAAAAQAAVGSFYVYFKSKSDVLLVLMDRLLLELELLNFDPPPEALAGADVRLILAAFVRSALQADLEYAGVYRAWREAIVLEPAIAAWDASIRAWTAGRIATVFAAAASLPGARSNLDLPLTAELVNRLFWDLLTDPRALTAATFDNLTDALIVTLYHILFER
jgi:AcrR family transcriptional regulator